SGCRCPASWWSSTRRVRCRRRQPWENLRRTTEPPKPGRKSKLSEHAETCGGLRCRRPRRTAELRDPDHSREPPFRVEHSPLTTCCGQGPHHSVRQAPAKALGHPQSRCGELGL